MAPRLTLPSTLQLASHRSSHECLHARPPSSAWELMVSMSLHPSHTTLLLPIGHRIPVPRPMTPYPLSPASEVNFLYFVKQIFVLYILCVGSHLYFCLLCP